MGSIISAVVNGALTAIFDAISRIMEKRGLIRQGQEQQAHKETRESEKSEARMNDALVNAPKTPDAALDRLRNGTA